MANWATMSKGKHRRRLSATNDGRHVIVQSVNQFPSTVVIDGAKQAAIFHLSPNYGRGMVQFQPKDPWNDGCAYTFEGLGTDAIMELVAKHGKEEVLRHWPIQRAKPASTHGLFPVEVLACVKEVLKTGALGGAACTALRGGGR